MLRLTLGAILALPLVGATLSATACGPAAHAYAQAALNAPVAKSEKAVPGPSTARPLGLDLEDMRSALASVPALAPLAASFVPFTEADADSAMRRGGHSREHAQPWTIMPSTFAWNPVAGKALWVLSGRAGQHAVIALLYALGDGRFEHAASTIIEEADTTIAIGSSDQYPKQLVWSTCYGCAGEGGTIRFGDDARVAITYR
jgi:hypothetical protein